MTRICLTLNRSFSILTSLLILVALSNKSIGQVSLVSEILISDTGLYFDGDEVAPSQRLEKLDRTDGRYDYAFGNRITPHGDCIATYGDYVFLTWYKGGKENRQVMLTRVNTKTNSRVNIEFTHKHTGFQNRWHIGESHNTIAVGISPKNETVHLLYDMHAYSPNRPSGGSLTEDYFRYRMSVENAATLPDDEFTLDKFYPKKLYLKQGEDYTGLTYPDFFVNDLGDLFVKMRVGGNDNGKFQIANYDGGTWSGWKDYNVLNAKSAPGINYNWGLYGYLQYLNGKFQIGYSIRKNDEEFVYNNGFFYSYSDDPEGINDWHNYKGEKVSSPLVDPYEIFFYEPADVVPGKVTITTSPSWTVTQRGDIHFMMNNVSGSGETRNVHSYKKASDSEFTHTTEFPGGELRSVGNELYLIGLENDRPIIRKAEGGTNDWTVVYKEASGKRFRFGNLLIVDGILYFYLMETGSGSGQPIWLQTYDLGINS
ncbi:BNR-4 repeat-containing protein [Algoriphagus aquimarinus]|uniref:BNR-4 repeat-containing protein n=1 Tax=Algoriphagus aquimarinus TaxID=237018 RepID=UPI0030D93FE6